MSVKKATLLTGGISLLRETGNRSTSSACIVLLLCSIAVDSKNFRTELSNFGSLPAREFVIVQKQQKELETLKQSNEEMTKEAQKVQKVRLHTKARPPHRLVEGAALPASQAVMLHQADLERRVAAALLLRPLLALVPLRSLPCGVRAHGRILHSRADAVRD